MSVQLRVSRGFIESMIRLPSDCWIKDIIISDDKQGSLILVVEGNVPKDTQKVTLVTSMDTKLVPVP